MRGYIQHIIMGGIFIVLIIGYFFLSNYTNSLAEERAVLIKDQEKLEKDIDKMLKGKSIARINNSYDMLLNYFADRSELMMRELFVFLEYVYPNNNSVESLTINKKKGKQPKIQLLFFTKDLEDIRKLYKRLEFFKNKGIITEFNLGSVALQTEVQTHPNGIPINIKYYTLDFSLTPNYKLIRDFVLQQTKEKNKKMYKKLYEDGYILLYNNINKEKEEIKNKNKTKKLKKEKE